MMAQVPVLVAPVLGDEPRDAEPTTSITLPAGDFEHGHAPVGHVAQRDCGFHRLLHRGYRPIIDARPIVTSPLGNSLPPGHGTPGASCLMMQSTDEAAWLRFFLHRLLAALRYAKAPETSTILRELIQEIENRLEEVEKR
jgi:hypothetical protein